LSWGEAVSGENSYKKKECLIERSTYSRIITAKKPDQAVFTFTRCPKNSLKGGVWSAPPPCRAQTTLKRRRFINSTPHRKVWKIRKEGKPNREQTRVKTGRGGGGNA